MDPLWQFIRDGLNQLRRKLITTQVSMATVTDTNQEKMEANQEKTEAKVDTITDAIQGRMESMIRKDQ
jgi:hypothetical protein